MKKAIYIVISVLMLTIIFTGCSDDNYINQTKVGTDMSNEVLRCFSENDAEALKSLFCEEIKSTHDLDKEIEEAMKFLEGEIVSHDKFSIGGGEAVDSGVLTDSHIGPIIDNIQTDANKTYDMSFYAYLACSKYPKRVGITRITIWSENEKTCTIGEIL